MAAQNRAKSSSRNAREADHNEPNGAHGHRDSWRQRVTDRSLERARQRSLERGQAFIDAALQVIRTSGVDDFTLQQVADRTGQSLRTFYLHFASKHDLLLAVYEEELVVHARFLAEAVARHSDPLERLAAFVVAGIEGTRPEKELVALSRYRLQLSESHPEVVAAIQAPVVDLARKVLADAVQAKAISPINVDHYAYLLITLKSSYLHSQILGNELTTELPTPVEFTSFCLSGLGAELPAVFADKKHST